MTFEPLGTSKIETASVVCIGTGRFLRAVLIPALSEVVAGVVLAQPRGTSFCEHIQKRVESGHRATYEVDTVLTDGSVLTTTHQLAAVGSLGVAAGRAAFMALPARMPNLRFIGLGVTEAGIAHNEPSMLALAEFLHGCFRAQLATKTDPPRVNLHHQH